MYGFYTPVLLLQAFCVYHAYRKNAEQKWYWLIVFFPLIGCILYLINNFNNRATISNLTEVVKVVVNSNYKIDQLEKALRFSDNASNKINLADAYAEIGRYKDSIELYQSCLQGFMADDPTLQLKLLSAHFLNADYESVVELGKKLASDNTFKKAEERVAFAWSLYYTGNDVQAKNVFEEMDNTFSNYHQRMEYCKFLLKTDKIELAKEKLTTLIEELELMRGHERRLKKNTFREIREMYDNLAKA